MKHFSLPILLTSLILCGAARKNEPYIQYSKRLQFQVREILEFPREFNGSRILRHSLSQSRQKLKESGELRISVVGNSLIASDHITDVFRKRLVERFGDGGKGLVLADRMAKYGRRTRSAAWSSGYTPFMFAMGPQSKEAYGISGVQHLSRSRGKSIFKNIDKGSVRVLGSGKSCRMRLESGASQLQLNFNELYVIDAAKRLTLKTRGKCHIDGIDFRNEEKGITVDTLGVPASGFSKLSKLHRGNIRRDYAALNPDLIIYLLGGNETKRLAWKRFSNNSLRKYVREELQNLQSIDATRDCMIVGPIDNIIPLNQNRRYQTRPELYAVESIFVEEAARFGCAYFDLFRASGGEGSIRRMDRLGWLHDDNVHPKRKALDAMGGILADALIRALEVEPQFDEQSFSNWVEISKLPRRQQ